MEISASLLTPELEALKGKEDYFPGVERLEIGNVRRYAQSINALDTHCTGEGDPEESLLVPFTYIFDVSLNIYDEIGPDGRGLGRFTIPGLQAVRGGNEYTLIKRAEIGDVVSMKRKIVDVYEKKGRKGPILFIIFEYTYTNQNGDPLGISTETMLYVV